MAHAASPLRATAPVERFFGYYPGTVSVITAAAGGARNVMSAGWHAALSAEPPLYGVALGRTRRTHALVLASGAFAVHFLPFERADAIAGVGSTSARDGVDKFERFGLATSPGVVLDLPILHDAYLAYECRVQAVHATGDHDWIVGEVVAIHHRPEAFDERRMLDPQRARAAIYYGRSHFEALGAGERAEHLPHRPAPVSGP
jgi:flavin reductase (DIM6/NTAB) family NADH-FMN oxidoreductase RutF